MLVVFGANGAIEQIVSLGETKEMEQAYLNDGKQIYRTTKQEEDTAYFSDKWMDRGILRIRPKLTLEQFNIKTNKETQIKLNGNVDECTVQVFHERIAVGTDTFTGDAWSIEVDEVGKYSFTFTPAFPIMPLTVGVEVTE